MKNTTVLVGIPTLNGPERLDRCLRSVADHTDPTLFKSVKVLVCDDGSTDENLKLNKDAIHRAEHLRSAMGLEMLMNERRMGIAATWNRLTRHQTADVVALINDDIEVVDDWLDVLVYSVAKNANAGMVSLRSYMGRTKQSHCETYLAGSAPPVLDYHEAQLMSGGGTLLASGGAAFAFRRSRFNAVGGFDERYRCFYEEVDFGVAMGEIGLYHYIASYPVLFHLVGATTTDKRNMDASEEMLRSRELFKEKWGKTPEEIRTTQAAARRHQATPVVNEWNSQLKFLKD